MRVKTGVPSNNFQNIGTEKVPICCRVHLIELFRIMDEVKY